MNDRSAWAQWRAVLCGALLFLVPASSSLAIGDLATGSSFVPQAETAALPRIGPVDAQGTPQVLARADTYRYRRIFALQEEGRWEEADRLIAQLGDRRLLGHVLEQRYMHPTAYRSSYSELRDWLAQYADQPGADRIYKLALSRKPADASAPRAPGGNARFSVNLTGLNGLDPVEAADEAPAQLAAAISRDEMADTQPVFTIGRGLAGSWTPPDKAERARQVAEEAAALAGTRTPMSLWESGLTAWRQGDIPTAASHFQAVVADEEASAWARSAAAYWAARAALRLGHPEDMSRWLRVAMDYPRSFYGLLAHQALGVTDRFAFDSVAYESAVLQELLAKPAIGRAVALLQAGQEERAAAELQNLDGDFDHHQAEVLLQLIDQAGLPAMALQLASRMHQVVGADGLLGTLDVGLFPLPPWEPESGFQLDRALVYALMRQESAFDPDAQSHMGASGLMQIMPSTASYVAGDDSLSGANSHRLLNPAFNLDVAQRYVLYLLKDEAVQGNLLRLTTAYNAGPGNLRRWMQALEDEGTDISDPLLFIESLPSAETRLFIRRVLTNLWVYRLRLGQPAPSLEKLAAGEWPDYEPLD